MAEKTAAGLVAWCKENLLLLCEKNGAKKHAKNESKVT